ncbi:transporter substrate-binding domain-containing protein [Erwiniaceae bacterium L1_54_6]|nr:transporter substrate-binding domain-containing protein [Erwiniaceae bacterium L1_54_6]
MNKFIVKVFSALLSCGVMASAMAKDELVIGFDPTYTPFEYKNADGSYAGFDYALGNALCQKLKLNCVWKEVDFDSSIAALRVRKIDAILSAMSITEERSKQVDFTVPVYDVPTALVVKSGSHLALGSLPSGTNIGVTQGTTQESYARKVMQPKGVNVISYESQDHVYQDLSNGRLDGTLTNAATASEGFLKLPQGKGFAISQPTVNDTQYFGKGVGIAFRKGDDAHTEMFNTAITEMKKSGEIANLSKKYFSFAVN